MMAITTSNSINVKPRRPPAWRTHKTFFVLIFWRSSFDPHRQDAALVGKVSFFCLAVTLEYSSTRTVHFDIMPRLKTVLTVALILGLAGLAVYLNGDWFAKRHIQISYRVSPWLKDARRARLRPGSDLGVPVVFSLDRYYRLTGVKVVIASDIATNKYAHPLWELVTASNSFPTASFAYG